MSELLKLHLGSGAVRLAGWQNIDLEAPEADLLLDLRQPLPFADGSVSHVFSEHVIEHIERAEALALLQECRRVLAPHGVVRVTTPDLAWLVDNYVASVTDGWGDLWQPGTPARMINEGMRYWGHCFIYDRPELARLFRAAGFGDVRFVGWRESDDPVLHGLETRPHNNEIIVEARVPEPAGGPAEPVVRARGQGRGQAELMVSQGQTLESLRMALDRARDEASVTAHQMAAVTAESSERAAQLLVLEDRHRADKASIDGLQTTIGGLQAELAGQRAQNDALLQAISQLHGVRAELDSLRVELAQVAAESRERAARIDQLGATIQRHEAYMTRLRASLPGRILFRLFKSLR